MIANIQKTTKTVHEMIREKDGSDEKKILKENGLPEVRFTVSEDATWAKRGFTSLIGVTSLIGKYTGKVLGLFVSSKNCKACSVNKKIMTPTEFTILYESQHAEVCQINNIGRLVEWKSKVSSQCLSDLRNIIE